MKALFIVFVIFTAASVAGCVDSVTQAAPLPGSHKITKEQRKVFADVARSVVGAYEALGRLDDRYDTEGICGGDPDDPDIVGEEDLCSIWRFSSRNPTLRIELTRFVPTGRDGAAGRYTGRAIFVDAATRRPRQIDIRLDYTGDDVRVRLKTGVASS